MNIFIRDALPQDAKDISLIIRDSMGYENPVQLIRENLERIGTGGSDKVLVAVYNDELIGFIHAENYDCLYAPHLKDLMSFAVKSKYQNKGVGTQLLEKIEQWAKETGACGVRILSSDNRLSAHKFYLAKGYVNEKTQLNFHKFF